MRAVILVVCVLLIGCSKRACEPPPIPECVNRLDPSVIIETRCTAEGRPYCSVYKWNRHEAASCEYACAHPDDFVKLTQKPIPGVIVYTPDGGGLGFRSIDGKPHCVQFDYENHIVVPCQ